MYEALSLRLKASYTRSYTGSNKVCSLVQTDSGREGAATEDRALLRLCYTGSIKGLLPRVQAETADARAQLEKIGASAKDLGAEKDRTAQQLADALVLL